MIPYQVVYCIPYLNIAFVMLTAHSAEWMLEFVGLGSYSMGEVMVDLHDGGEVPLSDWDGSMILLTQPLGMEDSSYQCTTLMGKKSTLDSF